MMEIAISEMKRQRGITLRHRGGTRGRDIASNSDHEAPEGAFLRKKQMVRAPEAAIPV